MGSSWNRMWSQRKVFVCLIVLLFVLMGNLKACFSLNGKDPVEKETLIM